MKNILIGTALLVLSGVTNADPSYTLTRHCILPTWRHSEDQPSMKVSRMVQCGQIPATRFPVLEVPRL